MKNDLNNLLKLAEKYVKYSKEINIKKGFTDLKKDNLIAQIYMQDNNKIFQIKFDKIEIVLFAKRFNFPFDTTAKQLKELHEFFTNFLNDDLLPNLKVQKERRDADLKKDIENEIEQLQKRLKEIKI